MQLLIDHGANLNFHQRLTEDTPLHSAVFFFYRTAIRALIEAGADLNSLDAEGKTPMMATDANYETILLFLKAGADY
jgi:ankyrin repeat protein